MKHCTFYSLWIVFDFRAFCSFSLNIVVESQCRTAFNRFIKILLTLSYSSRNIRKMEPALERAINLEVGPETKRKPMDGVAMIKPEFLIISHKEIDLAHVASQDKTKLFNQEEHEYPNEPPMKKLRGQNKSRPHGKRLPQDAKMCPAIVNDRICEFGVSCKYLHDAEKYLKTKPVDISKECYLFSVYGKCIYGVTCRFSSHHVDDGKNIVNESLWAKHEGVKTVTNEMKKPMQRLLWKRQYDFSKALDALKSSPRVYSNPDLKESNLKSLVSYPDMSSLNSGKTLAVTACETAEIMDESLLKTSGALTDEDIICLRPGEIKKIDFRKKLYLAPLTTVGNLPFRRVCKRLGADVTCGEMAIAMNLLQGQQSEWALLKRHESEDLFGVQICGAYPDVMSKCAQLLEENAVVDFVDINVGCPIDLVYQKGAGCGLMNRTNKFENIVYGMKKVLTVPVTAKIRTGVYEHKNTAHLLVPKLRDWGVSLVTMHGRSREARYTKSANWDYISECAKLADPMPFFGCGDVMSFEEYNTNMEKYSVSGIMLARGALLKPWIFTEIKEQRHWDISSKERLEIVKEYVNYGFDQWGCDTEGIEKTRKFLLEWLSFLYRYIPVGVLEQVPQRINQRPPQYVGRDDLETLMASPSCSDWVKISEMFLGKVPDDFSFLPKHKANAYR